MTTPLRFFAAVLLALALTGCASKPAVPLPADAPPIDLPRFMGTWHVVAHVPYFFERGLVATRDVFHLLPDGRIDNDFVFKRAFDEPDRTWHGVSTIVEGSGGREWAVQFVWPFSTRLQVLEVAPDYSTALLATPDRSLAWVFSREAVVDDAALAALKDRIATFGVDRAALARVPQTPEQLAAQEAAAQRT